jgi:hypothetical protein
VLEVSSMKTRITALVLVPATVFAVVATLRCGEVDSLYTGAPFSIGNMKEAVFDAGLVGVWQPIPTGQGEPVQLTVTSHDGRTYEVKMWEGDGDAEYEMTGFAVNLDGVRFFSGRLAKLKGSRVSGYILFRYQLEAPDGLVTAFIESSGWIGRGVGSEDELFRYMQTHAQDSDLYSGPTHYRRVSVQRAEVHHPLQPPAARLGCGAAARRACAGHG